MVAGGSARHVSVALYEIYGTKLFDLLNDRAEVRPLEDAKKRVQIFGLSEVRFERARASREPLL